MVKKIFEISSHKQGIYKSIHDIKNNVRSYIHNINQSIKTSQEEIENCSVKILNFDLKMRSLKKEFTNLSAKVRKAIPKFHFYRDTEEKLCNVCSEIYSEKRNFNWSCCGHPSEYGTGMYWCCGQTNIRAAGCKKMKHVCDVDQDLNLEEYKRVIIVCTSCKEAGHTSHSCPKDPNYINFELKVTKIAKISQFTSPRNSIISSGDLIRKSLDLPKAHIYKRKHKQSFEDINNIQESIRVNGFYVTEKLPIISERRFN